MERHHIEYDQLVLYLLNELPSRERKTVENHIRTCPHCQGLLEREKRFLYKMRNLPQEQPNEDILQECRRRLRRQLREEAIAKAKRRSWLHIGETITFRIPVKQFAAAAAIFLFGLALGRYSPRGGMNDAMSSQEAIRALHTAVPIGNFEVVPLDDKSNEVEIRFRTLQERRVVGNLGDPDIQYALAYALVNAPHDNIRLKSVQLLEPSTQDETVHRALIHALEKDENPGVRLKAIKLLNALPVSESIKKILVSALFYDPNAGIRIEAARALSRMDDPELLPILEKKASEDDYIRTLISKMSDNNPISLSRNN